MDRNGRKPDLPPFMPLTSDNDAYNFLSLGLNYNIGKKAVEPLWWINPLDYAYSEINAPRHMKLAKTCSG